MFRNAQSYKGINNLVNVLASDHQEHMNLYLFEEDYNNMLEFKNKYNAVYNNKYSYNHHYLINEKTKNETQCSITITEPPLKENNTFKIIGFVIILTLLLLFGFYKVLRGKVLKRKKQKNGKNK